MKFTQCILVISLFLSVGFANAQNQPQHRMCVTTYTIDMYNKPDFNSKKMAKIPENTVLTAIDETDRYGGYIKISYKGIAGYVLKAELKRYMTEAKPEIVSFSNGYKLIGSTYRYFLEIRNDGVTPYEGSFKLRFINKDGTSAYERSWKGKLDSDQAQLLNIDTEKFSDTYELTFEGGIIKEKTGSLIEKF